MAYTALEKMRKRNEEKFGKDIGPMQPVLHDDGPDSLDMKSAALRFIHERCEDLRFDRKIEEEELRTGHYQGTGSAPNQIPYNMQMDINRLCLERELEKFIDSGAVQDAYNVYYCFQEIFLGSYKKSKNIIEMLSEYETNGSSLLMHHRDHYSHSVYVFVIGLAVYETNANFRKAFHDFYHIEAGGEGDPSHIEAHFFLEFWGLTALFHDIGYPFELVFEQMMDYFGVDEHNRGINNPYIVYKNMKTITDLKPREQECFEQMYGKHFQTFNELLAFTLTRKLGEVFGFSEDYLRGVLDRKAFSPEDFAYYMDHGYFSALLLFQTLTEVMKDNADRENAASLQAFQYGHVDALGAIALHYVIYAYSIGFCYEGMKPKLSMNHHPLAWLLILCDELQCWDRIAYGRHSRSVLHPMSVEFDFRNNGLVAQYFYDEEEEDKIDAYLTAYAEWKKGGKVGDAPRLKAYSDMAGENKKFIRGIEELVDLTGLAVKVVCTTGPVDRSNKHVYLSNSDFMHMHDFAIVMNARHSYGENVDDVDQSDMEAEFANLSLEYKISNINQVKGFARYLNEIHCFYTDRPVDFDMIREFSPEEIEVIAPMEHERWVREHQAMGWRSGDSYEHVPIPEGVHEGSYRKMLREQIRCHKRAMDGNPTKSQILDHYHTLPEEEKGKDWLPFNRLLELIRKFDGLRIYRYGNGSMFSGSVKREPITSGSAKQDGNEIEHPTDFVRYKHAFIEEEGLQRN